MSKKGSTSGSTSTVEVEPFSALSLGKRISEIRGKESQKEFAQKMGVGQNTISQYERGERAPIADILVKIGRTYNISFEWLLTGHGPMRPTDAPSRGSAPGGSATAIDPTLLQAVIAAVRQALASSSRALTPAQEAQLITGVYEMFRPLPPGSPISSSAIHQLLDLIKEPSKK